MRELWHKVRGYIAAGVALIACPCHLLITLPLLLALTAGTALGAFLGENTPLVFAASTLLFVGGLVLGFTWLNEPAPASASQLDRSRPGLPAQRNGRAHVIPIHSLDCPTCTDGSGAGLQEELWAREEKISQEES